MVVQCRLGIRQQEPRDAMLELRLMLVGNDTVRFVTDDVSFTVNGQELQCALEALQKGVGHGP